MRWKVFLLLSILGIQLCIAASDRYIQLADSADYFIENKLWQKAEEYLLEALRLEPANFHNSMLLSNLGVVQMNKNELDKAIESFSLGLSLAPSSTVIHNNRARAFLLTEQIEEACADLDKSLSIDSIQEWPLQIRGLLYLNEYKDKDAFELFSKLKNNFPENPIAYSGLATISLRNGKADEAIELYKTSLEKNPDDSETLSSYIFLLIETGKYSEARTNLRQAIEKQPGYAMFYLLRGYLHRLNYRMDEAGADKKTALEKGLDPEYVKKFIP